MSNPINMSNVLTTLLDATILIQKLDGQPTDKLVSCRTDTGNITFRNPEHVMCKITADLRSALAEVEQERLAVFGWPKSGESNEGS